MVECAFIFSVPDPVFRADHPFLYYVLNTENTCPIFIGSHEK